MVCFAFFAFGGILVRPALAASGLQPKGPLKWGQVNFISTSDTHGWLMGHKPGSEPGWTGNLGDVTSFVEHMKAKARGDGVDLFFVDSGDMTHGSGLSDGGPSTDVEGARMIEAFAYMPYDLLTIGNHELYNYGISLNIHKNFAPNFGDRYLTSNAFITLSNPTKEVRIGKPYRKFISEQGLKVTAFGVTFKFAAKGGLRVQNVEDMIMEPCFLEAIEERPDLFLLIGHMSVDLTDKWPIVHKAIRAKYPQVPIFIFGGHTHRRDCKLLDDRTIALESGRYLETVGWISANITQEGSPLELQNRYLDVNRETFLYHTDRNNSNFDTELGKKVNDHLDNLAQDYNLDQVLGWAPQDYHFDRVAYPGESHVWTFYSTKGCT